MKMEAQIRLINIDDIIPNRFQPRLTFDDEALQELALSIREHGIIQPLVLRRVSGKFEIIAGERRYKASKLIGLTQVPAIITNLDDNESAEVAIIENTHRRDMSSLEEAKAYKKLLDRRYVTQDQLAKRLGTSQSNIANKIRLLSLDESVQDALMKNRISERHARSLLRITDKFKQVEILNKVIEEKWPVRKLDEEIDILLGTYKNNTDLTGGISTNKNDIDINQIMNNATDIKFDELPEMTKYQYQGKQNNNTSESKSGLFFNKLEDESANMNPSINFGFNPLDNAGVRTNEMDEIDELDLPDEEAPVLDDRVLDIKIDSVESTVKAIEKLKKLALENDIKLEMEEFDFDRVHQFIIRIDKEN